MSRFNLIDEAWIPVRWAHDGRREELGILETLTRAKEISVIEDPSPLVVAALHRFLLAVLYRALEGPGDPEEAKKLFKEGFPLDKIKDYLEKWRDRFYLFDEKYPFGQIPGLDLEPRSWTVLAAEHNADNAKVLFDHINVNHPGSITEAQAVRLIMATQTFAFTCGPSELLHTGKTPSPSGTGMMTLPLGASLRDTLLLSLVPESKEVMIEDKPIWEREPESISYLSGNPPHRIVSGRADLYTWRSRSILLAKESPEGKIEKLAFASGLAIEPTDLQDPMLAYQKGKKLGLLPMQLDERGTWRDFDSLLPGLGGHAPRVIEHTVELAGKDQSKFPRSVLIMGQKKRVKMAVIEYWRMERFTLPKALLNVDNGSVRGDINRFLKRAEETQRALESAMKIFAKNMLSPGGRKPAGQDVTAFIGQLPCEVRYWSVLEAEFHKVLQAYNVVTPDVETIELGWLKVLKSTLSESWGLLKTSVSGGDARAIRALAKAKSSIGKEMKQLGDEIVNFQNRSEKGAS